MGFNSGDIVKYIGSDETRPIWGRNNSFIPGVVDYESFHNEYYVKFQNGGRLLCMIKNLVLLTEEECLQYVDGYFPVSNMEIQIPSIKDLLG